MFDAYKKLFDQYLNEVHDYSKTMPYVCVITCNMRKEQLNGMLDLLFYTDIITQGQWGSERERVKDMFDARKICGHYQEPGEVCTWADFQD